MDIVGTIDIVDDDDAVGEIDNVNDTFENKNDFSFLNSGVYLFPDWEV